jgi:hypothetical protein
MRDVERWLESFQLDEFLSEHVAAVLADLPEAVRDDFMLDPAFCMSDYEPGPFAAHIPVRLPMPGRPSRSVVLKRTLRRRPSEFVRYVIAHELAHAHLRNRGRHRDEDPEHAADSLAAQWGFPRPVRA